MTRNFQCRYYNQCLAEAARLNAKDLHCANCEFRHDHSDRLDLGDLPGCLALVAHVFNDGLPDPRQSRSLIENGLAEIASCIAGQGVGP